MEDHYSRTAPRPPNSLDLAPSDFFLFGHVKEHFKESQENMKVFERCDANRDRDSS
jgi:hypothetical protein